MQLKTCIKKSGSTALIGNVSLTGLCTFLGASPTELYYLSGTISNIQRHLNNQQVLSYYVSTANYTAADGVINRAYTAVDAVTYSNYRCIDKL